MSKILIALLLIAISTCCFSQKRTGTFEIIGNVSGFKDSTCIKLYSFTNGMGAAIDSTEIINGKFTFKGPTNKDYQIVGIVTCDFKNIRNLWLENSVIHFKAKKGEFQNAKITGSFLQDQVNQLDSMIKQNPKHRNAEIIAFIKGHPNSIISGYNLKLYAMILGKDSTKLLYNDLSKKIQQSEYGKGIYEYISLNKDIKTGDKFVNFTLPDIDGKMISLSDYKGKYVLLDFWGSWCQPCREENPELVKIYHEFNDKGFNILGISIETDKKVWLEAVHHDNITWKDVSDLKGNNNKAALIYGVYMFPSNFLINPNGIVIAKNLDMDALRAKLTKMLK